MIHMKLYFNINNNNANKYLLTKTNRIFKHMHTIYLHQINKIKKENNVLMKNYNDSVKRKQ